MITIIISISVITILKTRTLYERSTIVWTSPDQGNRVSADLAHPEPVVFVRSQLTNHPRTLLKINLIVGATGARTARTV